MVNEIKAILTGYSIEYYESIVSEVANAYEDLIAYESRIYEGDDGINISDK